jgi:hypothetical protein
MNKKLFYVSVFLIFVLFLSGCTGGITTPGSTQVGGAFYTCENLLKAYYTALSNQNYPLALSYCKTGGIHFKFANSTWDLDQQYPTLYYTYQIHNVYNFSYLSNYAINCNYDMSTTQRDIYGGIHNTNHYYGRTGLFEKINGEWKLA